MKYDTIYLDLDGVVFDFDEVFAERYGKTAGVMTRPEFNRCFEDFIANKCFETLPLCKDVMPLLGVLADIRQNFGVRVNILTACGGHSAERVVEVSRQKQVALDTILKKYLEWDGTVFAYSSRHKVELFQRSAILIDDYHQNIDDWTTKGGSAIWHHDPRMTILALYEFMAEDK
jgi:hypothetical protein